MRERVRSWWRKIKQRRVTILVVAIILVATIALIFVEVRSYGTGFAGKTLFDWLNLLGVLAIPIVVGFGAAWFTKQQGIVSERENKDNQRETALQAYIDKMSELILDKHLSGQSLSDIRTIARVRTLTVLPRLDGERKKIVVLFLYDSMLINKDTRIVDLSQADMSGIDLHLTQLTNADLSQADLQKANLYISDLSYTDLNNADLRGAKLSGAVMIKTDLSSTQLEGADLSGALLEGADLHGTYLGEVDLYDTDLSEANLYRVIGITVEELEKQTRSLKGATMPDGSIHP